MLLRKCVVSSRWRIDSFPNPAAEGLKVVLNRLGVDGALHSAIRAVRVLVPGAVVTLGGGPEHRRWVQEVQRLRVHPESGELFMELLGETVARDLDQAVRAEIRRGVQRDSLVRMIGGEIPE